MEKYLVTGIVAFVLFLLARAVLRQQKQLLAYQQEIARILNDDKYKVKGKSD